MALGGELSCGLKHQVPQPCDVGLLKLLSSNPPFKDRHEVRRGFARAGDRVRKNVVSLKDCRNHLPLNDCRMLEL